MNLMADSESGSLDSYSSFLVTIHLSRLVLEIFACDRQTDGQINGWISMWTVTIVDPHIVLGQLITNAASETQKPAIYNTN